MTVPDGGGRSPWNTAPAALSALPAAGLMAIALLAAFAVPQADDFCYGVLVRGSGFIDAVAAFYETWSGRLAASILIMMPVAVADHLSMDLLTVYRIACLSLMVGLAAVSAIAVRALWPGLSVRGTILAGGVLAYVLAANMRSPRDLAFWLSGAFTYTVPALVIGATFVLLYRAARDRNGPSAGLTAVLAILALVAALCSEAAGPMVAFVALCWAVVGRTRGLTTAAATIILAAAVGTAVSFLSPGNVVRADLHGGSGDVVDTVVWAPIYFANYLVLRVDALGTLGWLLLAGLATWAGARRSAGGSMALIVGAIVAFVGCGLLAFAAGVYGIGSMLPARAQNPVHLLGALALTVAVVEAVRADPAGIAAWMGRRFPFMTRLTTRRRVLAVACVLIALSPQGLRALQQVATTAPTYAAEHHVRFDRLAAAAADADLVLPPLTVRPAFLHMEDVSEDPDHWNNRCVADFFGVGSVRVSPPTP